MLPKAGQRSAWTTVPVLREQSGFPDGRVSVAGFKQFVLAVAGSPEQFGAPKPADDVFEAGITMSQFFLTAGGGRAYLLQTVDRVC